MSIDTPRNTDSNAHAGAATDGVEQGDVAGPALFACGLKPFLERLRARLDQAAHAHGDVAFTLAYLDDLFFRALLLVVFLQTSGFLCFIHVDYFCRIAKRRCENR